MESAINTHPGPRSPNARAFAVGSGVTAALIAAAVAAFVSIAAFVAFEGMPFSSSETPQNAVAVSGAPNAAAVAAAPNAAAVAAEPATPSATAAAEIVAALPRDVTADSRGFDGKPGRADTPVAGGGIGSGVGEPPTGTPESPGALGTAVQGVDNAAGGLGLDLPLNEATGGLTGTVDDVVGGVLDGVGAGGVNDKVNDVLGGILGGN